MLARVYPLDRFWTGVLALACFEGAFLSEILRAGIVAIPAGQWACRALGLSTAQTYRRVVLPQAIVAMSPPLVSAGISLIKDSFMSFEIWLTVAAGYLVVTLAFSTGLNLVEARLRRRL